MKVYLMTGQASNNETKVYSSFKKAIKWLRTLNEIYVLGETLDGKTPYYRPSVSNYVAVGWITMETVF